jgi:hypothetical protein
MVVWKPGEIASIGYPEELLAFLWDGSLQTALISQLYTLDPTKILLRSAKELDESIMGGMFNEGPENDKQKLGGTGFFLADSFDRYPCVFNHLGKLMFAWR